MEGEEGPPWPLRSCAASKAANLATPTGGQRSCPRRLVPLYSCSFRLCVGDRIARSGSAASTWRSQHEGTLRAAGSSARAPTDFAACVSARLLNAGAWVTSEAGWTDYTVRSSSLSVCVHGRMLMCGMLCAAPASSRVAVARGCTRVGSWWRGRLQSTEL